MALTTEQRASLHGLSGHSPPGMRTNAQRTVYLQLEEIGEEVQVIVSAIEMLALRIEKLEKLEALRSPPDPG